MTTKLDDLVHAARPSDDEVDLDFSRIDHEKILRDAMAAGGAGAAPGIRRGRSRRAAGAGLVALALAGGALALGLHHGPVPETQPSAPTAPPVTRASAQAPAVLALRTVALSASRQKPVVIGPNQFLHVQFVETQTGASAGRVVHDTYVARDGWTWRHDTGSQDFWMLYDATGDSRAGDDSLPTDPTRLDATLRAGTGTNSGDERVWKGVDEILMTSAARPALRAAAIQVLQGLAQHPHSPEVGKQGRATPRVAVRWVTLDTCRQGLQATFTDAATHPGQRMTITLDQQGDLVSTTQVSSSGTFESSYPVRQLVDTLPADFVQQLGTQRRHVEK